MAKLPIVPALLAVLAAPGVLQSLMNMYPPFSALTARRGYNQHPDLIPSAAELVSMKIRGVISDEDYLSKMREAGYDEDTALKLFKGARQYQTGFDYVSLWRRGEISEEEADRLMAEIGFDTDEIARVKLSSLYQPTPVDVIRFAVRDVYTPSTVQKYGSDQDIPENYYPAALKAGLPQSTAKFFWMAHWELPSWTQVQEMRFRGLITDEDVQEYLRVADYLPYWRDKLAKITFHNLGRVDIRRMHAFGVLSEQEVYEAYKADGYDERNALLLTNFTIKSNASATEDTPKGQVIDAYKKGLIGEEELIRRLEALKMGKDAIAFTLELANNELLQEKIDIKADSVIDQYTNGAITLDEVYVQLTEMGVPARMLHLTVERELAQAKKRQKVASRAELDKWYTYGLISGETYRKKMGMLGYPSDDVERYLDLVTLEIIGGSAKKLHFSVPFRQYLEGSISEGQLTTMLQEIGYDTYTIGILMEIANSNKS